MGNWVIDSLADESFADSSAPLWAHSLTSAGRDKKVWVRLAPNPITRLLNYQFVLRDAHLRSDALGHKGLNHVAFLYVIEVLEVNTALHAVADFAGIVLKTPERTDLAFVNLHAIAHQANIGIALDDAVQHIAAGDGACLGYAERIANFRAALVGFLDDGLKQAQHGFLDLVLQLVNDRVQADIDFFHVRQLLRFALRTDIEADNHRI